MSTFEGELRALGKRRIALTDMRAAYLRAHPETLNAPDGRRLLLDPLEALERDGVVELPRRGWDTSGSPELPRTASLRATASSRCTPTPRAWLPALALGDLDPAGVRILIGVNARRQVEGRAPLRPHRGLYRWLLAHGHRRPLEVSPGDDLAQRLGAVFPADVASALVDLWSGRERVPQESFGLEQLEGKDVPVAAPDAA